ncbi:DoxX family protein [Dietzia cercidiphylli]|uniref:DoxX family protein n=2 Tax=Dietziaceae TaxID=85029 RepID=A0ABN2IB62_9ACTN
MRGMETLNDAAILLARLGLGAVFVAHGWQKFFTLGLSRVGEQFAGYGIPQPEVTAAVVAGVELIAGIALIAGILTPLAGILLAVDMAGALYFVHATNGPFVTQNGWELVVALGVGVLLIAAVGAGRFSIDRALGG